MKEAGKKDRVRERDVPLSEKLKFDETPEEAALRGISEELEGKQAQTHLAHHARGDRSEADKHVPRSALPIHLL